MTGTVYLIGAGPGDPELLTLKAARLIAAAEVVVYDRLVSPEIMAMVPAGAPKLFAGKSCKEKVMEQHEINALLVLLSKKYTNIVRLKGGDPFMFGRGGEEALELAKHHVPFEIIPGITSAQGCSAIAGIPLTHRGLATSVRYITGHRMEGAELELDWQSLADPDTTLVVYMGLANIEMIQEKLVAHGLAKDTPAAIIERGTTKDQRVIRCELSQLKTTTEREKIEAPSLLIIGKVAALNIVIPAKNSFVVPAKAGIHSH